MLTHLIRHLCRWVDRIRLKQSRNVSTTRSERSIPFEIRGRDHCFGAFQKRVTDFTRPPSRVFEVILSNGKFTESYSMVVLGRLHEQFSITVKVSGHVLKQVSEFVYLGYEINGRLDL